MQVGSFFEAYQTMEDGYELSKISSLLNVILSKKNKSIPTVDRKNPYMLGFPVPVIGKYMKVLMDNGFTIVLIEQTTPPPNPKREITGIYSPGTYIEPDSESVSSDNKYVLSLYLEENPAHRSSKRLISVGMSILDLTTGKSMVHEMHSNVGDDKVALDEAIKFIQSYPVLETQVITHKLTSMKEADLVTYLELRDKTHYIKTLEELKKEPGNKIITNLAFQEHMLQNIYTHNPLYTSICEQLNLESEYGRNAFVFLLKYAIDHNKNIVNKLEPPESYAEQIYLHIGNNACKQLNVFDDKYVSGGIKSLFDVIDATSTPMGRRFLKNALVKPLTDAIQLTQRYEFIHGLVSNKTYKQYDELLKEVGDTERLERKMKIQNLHPMEMHTWIKYQNTLCDILGLLDNFFGYDMAIIKQKQRSMLNDIDNTLVYEELQNHLINDITNNIFKEGVHPELDDIQAEIDSCTKFMVVLAVKLNEILKEKEMSIKVEDTERDGHFLTLTKRRADVLEKELSKMTEIEVKIGSHVHKLKTSKLTFKHATGKAGYTKIFLPEMDKNSDRIIALTMRLKTKVKQLYEKYLSKLVDDYGRTMYEITQVVSLLDFLKSGAKVADMYRYVRPTLHESDKSFIEAEQLRHPIVERINTETEYIPVDISLGVENQDGVLLFGLNSAGKSTLQKAVGISVIMAQIGYYVPATKYTYSPYHSMFTRISGSDNLFKGLSSFTLELVELQAILKRSGVNTLVIADEIASGTEHQSALIIVMSMIHILSKSRTSFITATHLHELVDLDTWRDIDNVRMYHLHVEFDDTKNELVYDRSLRPGHGCSFYGLTVAKYMIDDARFLKTTNDITKNIGVYTFVGDKTSRYNAKLIMDKCASCGHKPKKNEIPLETHHIEFQKDTDQDGFLLKKPYKHKNHKSNLVVLCTKCHDKIDSKELTIHGYKETSKGVKLVVNN
jgi:DNA mismatch repair protein MutS